MKAISPTGASIIGTADLVPANALIEHGSWSRNPDGTLAFEWVGDTDVCWDGQYTTQCNGKDLYVDENGETWTDDQITLVEDDDED